MSGHPPGRSRRRRLSDKVFAPSEAGCDEEALDIAERVLNTLGICTALLADAQAEAPADMDVMVSNARLLFVRENWMEMSSAAQRVIEAYLGRVYGYLYLARAKLYTEYLEYTIYLWAKTIQLNPRDNSIADRYWRMGYAHLLAGHYEESIAWQLRSLVV
jgi:hypothetical protein